MQPNGSAAHDGETAPMSDAESEAEILRLAGLPDLAYGRERKPAGEKLGLSLAWLDKVVNKKKAEIAAEIAGGGESDSGGQGHPIKLPEPKPGDLLAIMTAGAYGAVQSGFYNTRPLVPEVLVKGDQYAVVRPRIEVEALIAMDKPAPWL